MQMYYTVHYLGMYLIHHMMIHLMYLFASTGAVSRRVARRYSSAAVRSGSLCALFGSAFHVVYGSQRRSTAIASGPNTTFQPHLQHRSEFSTCSPGTSLAYTFSIDWTLFTDWSFPLYSPLFGHHSALNNSAASPTASISYNIIYSLPPCNWQGNIFADSLVTGCPSPLPERELLRG